MRLKLYLKLIENGLNLRLVFKFFQIKNPPYTRYAKFLMWEKVKETPTLPCNRIAQFRIAHNIWIPFVHNVLKPLEELQRKFTDRKFFHEMFRSDKVK